jgi:hypothetical protein
VSTNLDLVRSLHAAWESGDFRSTEWADPEIELVVYEGPAPAVWKGLSGLAEGWRGWVDAWEGFRVEPEEYRELDDERVLVLNRFSGRGKTSGLDLAEMHAKAAALLQIRRGKVIRLVLYPDRETALAQLGLPPDARSTRS